MQLSALCVLFCLSGLVSLVESQDTNPKVSKCDVTKGPCKAFDSLGRGRDCSSSSCAHDKAATHYRKYGSFCTRVDQDQLATCVLCCGSVKSRKSNINLTILSAVFH